MVNSMTLANHKYQISVVTPPSKSKSKAEGLHPDLGIVYYYLSFYPRSIFSEMISEGYMG